ncbi:unnamed protein product [Paramecium sonneborni]|uniref:EamA domain-containing protein n=1 Tax=Paramecium sonneborni TaxID=65129 RepID=A0A8S1QYF0_9CILI|nr:unnamed protein product [Paramecium sonneborni]CAD8120165.1 unnamed protein product [Paramecium sonneborni]
MDCILETIQKGIRSLELKQPRYAPIYYILTSSLLFSINSMLSKFVSNIPSSQIVYFRAIIMCLMNTIVTSNQKIPLYGFTKDIYKKLFMRSIFGCLGTICFYSGIMQVSVSEGQVLFRTSPLWTSLMAIYYLKTEKFQKSLFVNLILCFFGIFLISQPPILLNMLGYEQIENQQETQLMGIVLIILAAIFSSTIQVLINQLAKSVNQLVILQYFSIISIGVTSIALFIIPAQQWLIPNYYETIILSLIGGTSYFSQLMMNRAYMKGNLTEISMLGQSQVIYGYFIDTLMGTNLSIFSILGTVIILASLIKVVLDKSKSSQQQKGP